MSPGIGEEKGKAVEAERDCTAEKLQEQEQIAEKYRKACDELEAEKQAILESSTDKYDSPVDELVERLEAAEARANWLQTAFQSCSDSLKL